MLAHSAFDMALWDLKAQTSDSPLWKLLGGHDPKVPCYAGGIDLLLPIPALLRQTDGNLERGFRAIKMKVGRPSPGRGRRAGGRDAPASGRRLSADARRQHALDRGPGVRAARAFAPYDPVWLEEPVVPEDLLGHARVAAEGGLPVASGENLRSLWDFRELITAGKVSFPEPDVTNCGGVTAFMKIARLAEAFNLPVTSHGAHDVTVQLLAACPNRSWLEAHGFGLERYVAQPLAVVEGHAIAPDRSGHGIAFDWAALEAIRA